MGWKTKAIKNYNGEMEYIVESEFPFYRPGVYIDCKSMEDANKLLDAIRKYSISH